jgi:Icc-related predicted phosphoesterase
MTWFFASDLHGRPRRYRLLVARIRAERPRAVLLGGDLLPHALDADAEGGDHGFLAGFLAPALASLRDELGADYPRILAVPGNDDPRAAEPDFRELEDVGLWEYLPGRWTEVDDVPVLGYPWVPPTPFLLKDWERYDVSRYVDPGCIPPEEGVHSVAVDRRRLGYETIRADLERLAEGRDLAAAVMLCHAPPHGTALDRAELDGKMIDHAPLDPHVGSIALRRFIEARQPRLTLHGHVHESSRLTGAWRQQLGRSWGLSACTDGPELGLVDLDPAEPGRARRRLLR